MADASQADASSHIFGKPPFLVLLCGAKASGKSQCIRYVCRAYASSFSSVVVFAPTALNAFYDFLPTKAVHDDYDASVMKSILETQEKNKRADKTVHVLIIMDDIIGSNTIDWEKRKQNELSRLWAANRHWNLSIIVVTQSLKRVPRLLRDNVDYACIFRVMREAYAGLYETFGHTDRATFFKFLEENTLNYKTILYKAAVANPNDHFQVFKIPEEAMARKFKLLF